MLKFYCTSNIFWCYFYKLCFFFFFAGTKVWTFRSRTRKPSASRCSFIDISVSSLFHYNRIGALGLAHT